MKDYWQVVLAGEGGQGLVLAGVILGEAAVLAGFHAAQTAAYGIASRGGFAKSEVIISRKEIEYPAVEEPDVVLALSQEAMARYYGKVNHSCLLVYDGSTISGDYAGENVIRLPLSDTIATSKIREGVALPLNILSLGSLSGLARLVDLDTLTKAVTTRFGKASAANREALSLGFALGQVQRKM